MFRIVKSLNHNGVLAYDMDSHREYILLGKGIGFGKKVNERIDPPDNTRIYLLQEETERGSSIDIINNVNPKVLEITNSIIIEAEKKFEKIDKNVLYPLSDHIEFAIRRIKSNENISNPLTEDIKALFSEEYEIGEKARDIIKDTEGVDISDDEVGYIALHIHSALENENVSQAMTTAQIVKDCIIKIEETIGTKIEIQSLSYNRLSSHIKYMVARTLKGETIKLDMNDYIKDRFPKSFDLAQDICDDVANRLKIQIKDVEVGYLAMHIERVFSEDI